MRRINLTDGRWFDPEKATEFAESRHHDGHNFCSHCDPVASEIESLYCTAGGTWVLCHWSQRQRSGPPTYTPIAESDAAEWLCRHEHDETKHAEAARIIAKRRAATEA